MPQVVKQVSTRSHVITAVNNGVILTFGPAATPTSVGTFIMQFNPTQGSDVEVVVMGRCWGQAAKDQDVPFVPVPYRVGSLNDVAQIDPTTRQGWPWSLDPIGQSALIQIPGNWEVGLLVSAATGETSVTSWNLLGAGSL